MKIFALYLRVNLTKKPEWFEDFRKKHDEAFDLHLTLIQPHYIKEDQVDDLKIKVINFLNEFKLVKEGNKLFFDKLVIEETSDDKFVCMLFAQKNETVINFQKELRAILINYKDYYEKASEKYEINFQPHLTIGRDIGLDQKIEIERNFSLDFVCEGLIKDLVLPVVADLSPEEAIKPSNLLIFNSQQIFSDNN